MGCGGLREREIDDLVLETCRRIRENVVLKGKEDGVDCVFDEFTPIKVKSQVVAGTNLFVKVRVGAKKVIHIRVWCKLDRTLELSAVQWNKGESDNLAYF